MALIVIYTLFAGVVGIAAAIVAQRLLAPIRTLTDGVKAVASGDLSRKVEVRSDDDRLVFEVRVRAFDVGDDVPTGH